jgi:ankyrin repeat protein
MKKVMAIVLLALLSAAFLMATTQKAKEFIVPIFGGKIDEVDRLIKEGVDVNEKFGFGAMGDITALVLAVMLGRAEICNVLIDAGADVNIKSPEGVTLLHDVAFFSGDYKDIAELLISKGLDVNAKCTHYGEILDATPLHLAAAKANGGVAETLIKNGAEVNAKLSYNGYTPLHLAARDGHKEVTELLITKGAEVNARTKYGETPLDLAISKGHKELADLLRKHGGISGKNEPSGREKFLLESKDKTSIPKS